ncbi:15633_t:CDS:2, partial [Cetraspora pellucida]
MSGNAEFDQAAKEFETIVKTHNDKISNDEKLDAYGLYKQATVGKNTTAKPGIFSLEGKA